MFDFLVAAMALAAQPAPTAATEMLRIDVPDEFQVGYHHRTAHGDLMEMVVPPETVDNWSTLITGLDFFDTAKVGVENFYPIWRRGMIAACPGMTETFAKGTVDGHRAIKGVLSCPLNPRTNKPENLTAIFVQGDVNLLNVQVAFRHNVGAKDQALIDRISASLKVCDQQAMDACTARKAMGFVVAR